jgi:hypothetical protein
MAEFSDFQHNFNTPYGIGVRRGMYQELGGIDKFGYLPTATSSYKTVWDGDNLYTYPSSAVTMTATSASGATDSGVEVTIQGLDTDYVELTETVTLDGSGIATTTGEFLRVFRAFISNGQAADGNVSIANGGTTYALIGSDYQQTLMAVYTIPKGKRGYLVAANISVEKSQPVVSKLMTGVGGGILRANGIVSTNGVPFQRVWQLPPVLDEKTDIEIRAKAGATTSIAAGFEILLEDK